MRYYNKNKESWMGGYGWFMSQNLLLCGFQTVEEVSQFRRFHKKLL